MDTTTHVSASAIEPETTIDSTTGCEVSGGMDVKTFANKYSVTLFWSSVAMAGILVLLLLMFFFGYLHFGKATTSKYTSTFVPKTMVGEQQSNFGNYPNWYMQDGCAGYNCSVDTNSGRSLGFGVSDFETKKSNFGPLPGVRQHMAVSNEAQKQAAADFLQRSNMENQRREQLQHHHTSHMTPQRQEHMRLPHQNPISHMQPKKEGMTAEEAKMQEDAAKAYINARTFDEVGARQARVLAGCNNAWDPMATEEAKVLGSVGVYKPNTPGMSSFTRAVNDNVPLTDAQLEAIMQGGEPYTIAPVSVNDSETLAAQQRQQQAMAPARQFV
jgi:hypothetical protein